MSLKIAHSNIRPTVLPDENSQPTPEISEFALRMKVKGYRKACKKYAERIKEIQKYFPGWMPNMNY